MNPFTENITGGPPKEAPVNYELHLLQTLINVVKVDKQVQAIESAYIEQRIHNSSVSAEEKSALLASMSDSTIYEKTYAVFAAFPEKRTALVSEIMKLANIDDYLSLTERIYLRQIFKGLGLEEQEILALMLK